MMNRVVSAAMKSMFRLFSLRQENRKLSILIYHRVLPESDPMRPGEIHAELFEWHLQLVNKYFTVLPLTEAVKLLQKRKLPANALCVTFDDGYADNEEIALPLLIKWNTPATFYIATGFLNGGRMWNDTVIESIKSYQEDIIDLSKYGMGVCPVKNFHEKRILTDKLLSKFKHMSQSERELNAIGIGEIGQPLPTNLMMTHEQVRNLHSAGMDIGGHTVTHPILSTLGIKQVENEIVDGKTELERICAGSVVNFAYPNGKPGKDYLETHVKLVKQVGFKSAVSTQWGVSDYNTDIWQLRRFTPWDTNSNAFLYRMIRNHFEN